MMHQQLGVRSVTIILRIGSVVEVLKYFAYHPNTNPEVLHRYYTTGLGTGTPEFEADAYRCADSVYKFGLTAENRIKRHKCGMMVKTKMQELEDAW